MSIMSPVDVASLCTFKRGRAALICLLLLFICFDGTFPGMNTSPDEYALAADVNVVADFSVALDPPLVKKFDFMNSGIVPMWRYRRDLNLIDDFKAQ